MFLHIRIKVIKLFKIYASSSQYLANFSTDCNNQLGFVRQCGMLTWLKYENCVGHKMRKISVGIIATAIIY